MITDHRYSTEFPACRLPVQNRACQNMKHLWLVTGNEVRSGGTDPLSGKSLLDEISDCPISMLWLSIPGWQ